jgi:hypothetical protein
MGGWKLMKMSTNQGELIGCKVYPWAFKRPPLMKRQEMAPFLSRETSSLIAQGTYGVVKPLRN